MSRKRKPKSIRNRNQHGERFYVSLTEWRRFQQFMDNWDELEGTLNHLKSGWHTHVDFMIKEVQAWKTDFQDMDDAIISVYNQFKRFSRQSLIKCDKSHKYNPAPVPKKGKPGHCVAEIVVEDISTGNRL